MKANSSPMSVADYCHDFNAKKIIVNDEYQRNTGLWTAQARSFFIESILLEFPIPKLYVHAKLDLKSRQQIKEVVDGQQRSQALVSFFNNKQKLTRNIDTAELRGLNYNQLGDDWKSKFLSYSLPIDQFSGAPDDEVREAFRRMNANNVPLNDEEQRNAKFQGPFKWFIVKIADDYKAILGSIGVFTKRDLIRMSDLKLYADIILTVDSGFQTIKGIQIDTLYKKYNGTFLLEDEYAEVLHSSLEKFLHTDDLQRTPFYKAHIFQTIILAIAELQKPGRIPGVSDPAIAAEIDRIEALGIPLEVLADSLSEPEAYPVAAEFIAASTQKTNVGASRLVRFAYFKAALPAVL